MAERLPARQRVPERYQLVCVCFLAAASCYLDRVGFPLAYTSMASKVGVSKETQGAVHSAFYNGYTVSQARARPVTAQPVRCLRGRSRPP